MAYIREFGSKWRVEIQRHGTRKSKVFRTREDAQEWGDSCEALMDRAAERVRMDIKDEADSRPLLASAFPIRVINAMRSIPHGHHEITSAAFHVGDCIGVYFLVRKNEVVYVGQTTNLFQRLARHQRDGKAFDSFSFIRCEKDKLDELESMYIDAFLPSLNRSTGPSRATARSPS